PGYLVAPLHKLLGYRPVTTTQIKQLFAGIWQLELVEYDSQPGQQVGVGAAGLAIVVMKPRGYALHCIHENLSPW
ncbi:MAG TPA: hypothetical protein PKA06_04120, partial [Gemmatales bacterium]|nr:hypothetical protein [Gemmatales bacterium]